MSLKHSRSQHGFQFYRFDSLMGTGPHQSISFRGYEGGCVKDFIGQDSVSLGRDWKISLHQMKSKWRRGPEGRLRKPTYRSASLSGSYPDKILK